MLEDARRKRQEEDIEQKAKIDDLFIRTKNAAETLKERAESEFQMQKALRERYMNETDDLLAKGREELAAIVRVSEETTRQAEERLKGIKAETHIETSRASAINKDMQDMIREAQMASSTARAEVNEIRRGVHAECCAPVDGLLRTCQAAQETLRDMYTEQQDLMQTKSRGLELEARCAIRHAVRIKELRKHLTRWTAGHEMSAPTRHPDHRFMQSCDVKAPFTFFECWLLTDDMIPYRARFRNSSLQRIIHLPELSIRADHSNVAETKRTFQMQI